MRPRFFIIFRTGLTTGRTPRRCCASFAMSQERRQPAGARKSSLPIRPQCVALSARCMMHDVNTRQEPRYAPRQRP